MTVPATTDLGVDLRILPDIGTRWTLSSGNTCVAEDLVCALSSDEGSLIYAPAWPCYNVLRQVNGTFTRAQIAALNSRITAVCLGNPKVQSANVQTAYDISTSSLVISMIIETAAGPFSLVLSVSALSVDVLNAEEIGVAVAITPVASTEPTFAGPPGPAGPPGGGSIVPGPPGPAGTSNQSFSSDFIAEDDSGNELVWWQFTADLSNQPSGTLTLDFTLLASSIGGDATFKAYVGGAFVTSLGVAPGGGTVVATQTRNGTGLIAIKLSGTFTNPTGVVPIQITMKSAGGAGNFAQGQNVNGLVLA